MQRSLMALVVVEITGTLVFMLKLAVPPPAKGDKGGITTNPLLATARFDQWDPLTATEATMLASNRFGFHPVVSHGLSSLPLATRWFGSTSLPQRAYTAWRLLSRTTRRSWLSTSEASEGPRPPCVPLLT